MTEVRSERRSLRAAALVGVLIFCVVLFLAAAGGRADIFKCKGPNGNTVYTSDPSACPEAEPHELKTEMQTVVPASKAKRSTPAARVPADRGEMAAGGGVTGTAGKTPDGMIEMWRRKRPEAKAKLEELKKQAAYYRSVVGGCNRGSTWYAKDESGLKHEVSCEELRSRSEKIEREIAKLEAYLAGGLEEECRRAGCLPGWVR